MFEGLPNADPFAAVGEHGSIDYAQMNKGVRPVFRNRPEIDPLASEKAGHPVHRNVEEVLITIAGDSFSSASHPVDDAIKMRFSAEYDAWKAKGVAMTIKGIPLREWPLLSALQVADFEAAKFYSIEDIADLSDSNVNRIMDGRIWRQKAIAWLEQAKDGATATRLAAENERLRLQIEALSARMGEIESGEGKRGPGRPRSVRNDDALS